jgi:hypothetical protein
MKQFNVAIWLEYNNRTIIARRFYSTSPGAWKRFIIWRNRCENKGVDYFITLYDFSNLMAGAYNLEGRKFETEFTQFHPRPVPLDLKKFYPG